MSDFLSVSNSILWAQPVLFVLLGTGVLFTFWSGFAQYRALTHGTAVVRGKYDNHDDPGAISHFQALSAALSATVGLGNIGGVALAIALGGPGAVFWMWIVGLFGMAIKITEVTLSMLYRNTDDPDNPHGGPMWVVAHGLPKLNPKLAGLGKFIGVIFCLTLLVSTATGGNMFQAWNVGEITEAYFGVPSVITGIILALVVGAVIIGGIKRIGKVAGTLVPFMVALYLLAGFYVLAVNVDQIPAMFSLIITGAFSPQDATGAFIGGTVGYAFLIGMKRALFSNEAGQGSSPIAHSAAKTDEPVREGIVAGLEPFIDTIVVCTFTALIILSTGVWNRDAAAELSAEPFVAKVGDGVWQFESTPAPDGDEYAIGAQVFVIVEGDTNTDTG
ncbi:MAG: amino acid carrier protein, partial [Pseudomonadota bacterium]